MKILLISHNPISTSNNMGKTLFSLFSTFEKREICQFYVHPSLPDVRKCDGYYRITDKNVLKGILKFSVKGTIISEKEIDENRAIKSSDTVKAVSRKTPARYLVRDFVWKISKWYTKELRNWVSAQNPDVIFLAPGYAKFIYNIALKISKEFNLPIVVYICDDYYFVQNEGSLLKKIQVGQLKRKIAELMKHTSEIISICDGIKTNYESKFNVPCTTIMTGSSFNAEDSLKYYLVEKHDKNAFVYLGNVRCNRYKSLVEIGQALEKINNKEHSDYRLKIYTSETDEKILNRLKAVPTIELCGYVSGDEFLQTLCSAEVLVHTESFDDDMIDLVKNSISTKIADSLASGRKFFAYGPGNIASIKYLKSNNAAYVAVNSTELEKVLLKAITEGGAEIIERAKECASKNHDSVKTSRLLHERLEEVCKGAADESSAN